jgi:hypothetical protein
MKQVLEANYSVYYGLSVKVLQVLHVKLIRTHRLIHMQRLRQSQSVEAHSESTSDTGNWCQIMLCIMYAAYTI